MDTSDGGSAGVAQRVCSGVSGVAVVVCGVVVALLSWACCSSAIADLKNALSPDRLVGDSISAVGRRGDWDGRLLGLWRSSQYARAHACLLWVDHGAGCFLPRFGVVAFVVVARSLVLIFVVEVVFVVVGGVVVVVVVVGVVVVVVVGIVVVGVLGVAVAIAALDAIGVW